MSWTRVIGLRVEDLGFWVDEGGGLGFHATRSAERRQVALPLSLSCVYSFLLTLAPPLTRLHSHCWYDDGIASELGERAYCYSEGYSWLRSAGVCTSALASLLLSKVASAILGI